MSKKITPQEVFQSAYDAYVVEERHRFKLPKTWEEVSEHDKALFTIMAFKLNCIIGEMTTDDHMEVGDQS